MTSTTTASATTTNVPPPSVSLKRKRPPKIEIPSVLREIPKEEVEQRDKLFKDETPIQYSGKGVGLYAMKGKKKFMEDTHKIVSGLNGNSKKGFFGVYDGHGGRIAADFVAENLHGNILGMLETCEGNTEKKEEAVRAGYLKTDGEFLKKGLSSGTCCVTCVIEEKDIIVSNVGDCRAVLCKGGAAEALTVDHRAEHEMERNRIENKGGYVEIHRGAWRVHGVLSVSRSIGDAHLKDWVLAEPDTKILTLTPDMNFIVLASDGLWEKVGNQEAVDAAVHVYLGGKPQFMIDPQKGAENEFGCENTSPPSKSRKISVVNEQKTNTQYPMRVRLGIIQKPGSATALWKEDESAYGSEDTSPPSKLQKSSLLKQSATDLWKEDESEYGCENTSPPSKLQRISLVKQCKQKTPFQDVRDHSKRPTSSRLMDACKELVNLAVIRGSLDDITVMIIDLEHFQRDTSYFG